MEIFNIERQIDSNLVEKFLKELFPCLSFFYLDELWNHPKDFDVDDKNHLTFNFRVSDKLSRFPVEFGLYGTPENNSEERALYIGKRMSDAFSLKVLVSVKDPTPQADPYLNVLFEDSKAVLVGDYDYDWIDGLTEEIEFLGDHSITDTKFDGYANRQI